MPREKWKYIWDWRRTHVKVRSSLTTPSLPLVWSPRGVEGVL
jgi:hypothetical protein